MFTKRKNEKTIRKARNKKNSIKIKEIKNER